MGRGRMRGVESYIGPGGIPGSFKMSTQIRALRCPRTARTLAHRVRFRPRQRTPHNVRHRVIDEDYGEHVADTLTGLVNGSYLGPSGESKRTNGEPQCTCLECLHKPNTEFSSHAITS